MVEHYGESTVNCYICHCYICHCYARGIQKALFHCSAHEETEVMAVCSRDTETVIHDQSFFHGFRLCLR